MIRPALLVSSFCGAVAAFAADVQTQSGKETSSGVAIAWSYAAHDQNRLGIVEARLSDVETGRAIALSGDELRAWLVRDRSALSDAEIPCVDRIATIAGRGFGRRADIDIGEARLLTLNADGSLTFINPQIALNNAKLETIVDIGGRPKAWLQIPERAESWIATEAPPQLIAVDLQKRGVVRRIPMPAGEAAEADVRAMAYDASGRALWIAMPGAGGFGVVDLDRSEAGPRLVTAPEAVGVFAATALSGVVTLERSGAVALRQGARVARRWRLESAPIAGDYSVLRKQLVIASARGEISWLAPQGDEATPVRTLRLDHGVERFRLFDEGRRALAIGGGRASVIDVATGETTLSVDTLAHVDEIALTSRFAYAVDHTTGKARAWLLSELRSGRAVPVEIVLAEPDDETKRHPSTASRIAVLAGGHGLLVANRKAGVIFSYQEGMMATSGSLSNYRRAPIALDVLESGFRSVGEGAYQAAVRPEAGGRYWLLMAGAGPRFSLCARLTIPSPPDRAADSRDRYRASLVGAWRAGAAPGEHKVRVRLEQVLGDGSVSTRAGVRDMKLLLFDRLNGWQSRTPMREGRAGEYEALVTVPYRASYEALMSSPTADLSFLEGRIGTLHLEGPP